MGRDNGEHTFVTRRSPSSAAIVSFREWPKGTSSQTPSYPRQSLYTSSHTTCAEKMSFVSPARELVSSLKASRRARRKATRVGPKANLPVLMRPSLNPSLERLSCVTGRFESGGRGQDEKLADRDRTCPHDCG